MKKFTLLIGTGNSHKREEIAAILNFPEIEILTLTDLPPLPEPVEDGGSFEANALIKARYYYQKTGIPCLADDSGLSVNALNGAPGIFSSRFAGENANDRENDDKLLSELKGVKKRDAHYTCVIAFTDGITEKTAEGKFFGKIGYEYRGSYGFGYDPIFYFEHQGKVISVAELDPKIKNNISHRANALRNFYPWFQKYLAEKLLDKSGDLS
jgi:XTP/dITP diphosphohydrolase